MNIRLVQETDLSDIHALGVKVFGPIAHTALVIRQLYDLHHSHIFAAYNPNIVGYCIGGIEAGGKIGHIVSLAVDPDARRQRVGFLLTEKVMQVLKKEMVNELRLVVCPTNHNAINLYFKLGFERENVVPNYFGPGADRLKMRYAV